MQAYLAHIEAKAKAAMQGLEPGHDFSHIGRVVRNAMAIQQCEGGDAVVVRLGALLHEMGDSKFFDSANLTGTVTAWLNEGPLERGQIDGVMAIVHGLGFSKEMDGSARTSLEFGIVQDADRLEALGAIGIARTFSYGGSKGRPFFDEEILPATFGSGAEYRASESPTVNHFFEKLFLLKDRMTTTTGRQMALQRHRLLWDYLAAFFAEHGFNDPAKQRLWLDLLEAHRD